MWSLLATITIVGAGAVGGLIPLIKTRLPAKLTGKDLCKRGTPAGDVPIPESLGIVSGCVFVGLATLLSCFMEQHQASMRWGIASIAAMIALGFWDDLHDLRWRHKLLFPPLATIPVLLHYSGVTAVVIPKPVRGLIAESSPLHDILSLIFDVSKHGEIIDLGIIYYVYMGMMAVFCTNAINIYAGINGLEAGQSFVIGLAVVLQNLIQIVRGHDGDQYHYFSLVLMIPFLATTFGLLIHNWYPSKVFVGDTFCYYAGMTFAVAGILGHFSKTLLLFFAPQILNFLYSIPQLFRFVPCPRHRLPKFNPATGNLEPSTVAPDSIKSNMTMLNLFLVIFGPMPEKRLLQLLLAFQAFCCALAFGVRYGLSSLFYDTVN
ncbi:UDP-N-acetylglucosamine-dolichyl-phosphate N-acetylglucosaminephosphotransferase [Thraustotheca clavata]|uniref:UDP-N-acetylglucosamine--dolichyl-phosphate N-acetylglucosaminephosphotransferase n=1 Tax=Thraustotheca clavata TaxID=74557 RepID=A0A1W0A7A1_9STRA|nr:UDP-N-acetylglucosamine-dolichyl-phosphate N-acetylglucosaminephosphotransferase [Thraustotheca clavata]